MGVVLVFKLILMGLFSSDYQDQMFIPFVKVFLSGENPYEFFYKNGLPASFPYFPFMLLIEGVGGGDFRAVISRRSLLAESYIQTAAPDF